MYANVLVEYSNKAIDKSFTYIIPPSLINSLKVGMKVKIPFNNRIINGFVIKITDNYDSDYELKSIYKIESPEIYLNKELLSLGTYLQERTLCTKIVAYQTMFPSALKIKDQEHNYNKYDIYLTLNQDLKLIDEYILTHKNSHAQIALLNALKEQKILKNKVSKEAAKRLLEEGLIKEEAMQKYRLQINDALEKKKVLNAEQSKALKTINLVEYKTYLLFGVTGSGKTEVYMQLIEKVIEQHKTSLILVPEISLTAQVINNFYQRFGHHVAIFHSGLSNGEKYDEYLKIYRGEVDIVVGTRSAIFAPLNNLGIVIIDEEQSDAYHQEDNPRYSAIEMAEFRCRYNKCPLVLGSATPTLESMARAKKGVYELISMPNRINNQVLPNITLVDMANEMKNRHPVLSALLIDKISNRLAAKEQIILLLNRRGYSTIVTCQNCGYTYKCPHCDITLTYHKTSNSLRCHYCGYTKILDNNCPECHEEALTYLGLGTEKLEQTLNKTFPMAKVIRMDVDTTSKKGSHEKIITAFKNHEYDILLGTQMISKGLDFPKVTLVGVINADASLNVPDFRSGERTFELLSQVAGRSGRANIPGEVIIQTFNPDNKYLTFVQENNYEAFYRYEMPLRKLEKYSPYYYIISIQITSPDYDIAGKEINKVYKYLKSKLLKETIILGPTTANIFKLKNLYRFQLLIKYRYDAYIIPALKHLDEIYGTNNKVKLNIDINPSHL